ncbi:glucose-6-phosphate dehydrogenase [soil metagenome]
MKPHLFVLFGATGDLAERKIYPALYRLCASADLRVLGVGRTAWTDEDAREAAANALVGEGIDESSARTWAHKTVYYEKLGEDTDISSAMSRAADIEREADLGGNRVYYLAIPPFAFPDTIEALGQSDEGHKREGWTRLVIEKPFGKDLESAHELNDLIHRHFTEEQVFRIDHYLGKETVQNLMVFRFANAIFESVWNRNHVERVEITVAEEGGVGSRAGYYEGAGALRDMVQNHLTQLLTLAAMEVPSNMDAVAIRNEKIKVLRSAQEPTKVVFGQYASGEVDGESVPGYLDEDGVDQDSRTETYVAIEMRIANWRWQGVPFVLRTGKRLRERLTEIAVYFRCPPVGLFEQGGRSCSISRNVLRIRLQPSEGFSLAFEVKQPGAPFTLSTQRLNFQYEDAFGQLSEAYETLLRDIANGDQTLFVHADEVEAAWKLYSKLLDAPRNGENLHTYSSGSWGPDSANSMFVGDEVERGA